MVKENNNNNFALIALVAIVAVVGMVGLFMNMNSHSAGNVLVPSQSYSENVDLSDEAVSNFLGDVTYAGGCSFAGGTRNQINCIGAGGELYVFMYNGATGMYKRVN